MLNNRVPFILISLFASVAVQTQLAQATDLSQLPLPGLPQESAMLPEVVNPLHLVLNLSQRRLSLMNGDQVLKSFPVAVGKSGWETPVGEHTVQTMVENPAWRHWDGGEVIPGGDPENPLGTRWIGFWSGKTASGSQGVAGFHGTTPSARASIGTAASHGCVRMYQEDIEALFNLVQVGMPVNVVR